MKININFKNIIKKVAFAILAMIIIILIIPIIINFSINNYSGFYIFTTGASKDTWINFWGSYSGGILGSCLGGLIAYKIARYQIDKNNEKSHLDGINKRQQEIFKNLLLGLAGYINNQLPDMNFVNALNSVYFEFTDKKDILILRKRFDNFIFIDFDKIEDSKKKTRIINIRNEILIRLVKSIGKLFSYPVDTINLNKLYYPKGYADYTEKYIMLFEKINLFLDKNNVISVKIVDDKGDKKL